VLLTRAITLSITAKASTKAKASFFIDRSPFEVATKLGRDLDSCVDYLTHKTMQNRLSYSSPMIVETARPAGFAWEDLG
jgi:hypothetical protein